MALGLDGIFVLSPVPRSSSAVAEGDKVINGTVVRKQPALALGLGVHTGLGALQ